MPLRRGRPEHIHFLTPHSETRAIPTQTPRAEDQFRTHARQVARSEPFNRLFEELDRELPHGVRPNPPMPHIEVLLRKEPHLTKEAINVAEKMGLTQEESIAVIADELRKRLANHRGYSE